MKDLIIPLVSIPNANFIDVPLGEGFGFNGNILETNILNLAVVLGIVISFGGDALRSLLETRRQTILNNLQQAEKRALEAQRKLAEAKYQLEAAQKRALEIQKQGNITAEKEKKRFNKSDKRRCRSFGTKQTRKSSVTTTESHRSSFSKGPETCVNTSQREASKSIRFNISYFCQ